MRTLSLLFLLLSFSTLPAQHLSKPEAYALVDSLAKKKLINHHGHARMHDAVKFYKHSQLHITFLLNRLRDIYADDFRYRTKSGFEGDEWSFGEEFGDDEWGFEGDSDENKRLVEIEKNIPKEDPLPDSTLIFYNPFDKKISAYHVEDSYQYQSFGYSGGSCVPSTRSTIGKTFSRTVRDLQDLDLVDTRVYKQIQKFDSLGLPKTEAFLFEFIASQTYVFQKDEIEIPIQRRLIDVLRENEMISESNQEKLLDSYKDGKAKTMVELFSYCRNTFSLDSLETQKPYRDFVTICLNRVSLQIEDFDISAFATSIDTVRYQGRLNSSLLAKLYNSYTFQSGGYSYTGRSYAGSIELKEDSSIISTYESDDIFHVFDVTPINKWLNDQGSLERLYALNPRERGDPVDLSSVVMLLKHKEAYDISTFFKSNPRIYTMDMLSHSNKYNSAHIARAVHVLDSVGYFGHLTIREKQAGIKRIESTYINNYSNFNRCFHVFYRRIRRVKKDPLTFEQCSYLVYFFDIGTECKEE